MTSCEDVLDANVLLLCQVETDMYTARGDSEAPVFTITNQANYQVELDGIIMGYIGSSPRHAIYSPFDLTHTDLGPTATLDVCTSPC